MGIKHFFIWFKKNHSNCVQILNSNHNSLQSQGVLIDTLGLDLNGLFHPVAQEVFQYGAFKKNKRLLRGQHKPPQSRRQLNKLFFKKVCETIDNLVKTIHPKRRLLLCVDGIAGNSKMAQQRQRRFKSSIENSESVFDTCEISPGTELMVQLSVFIDSFIQHKIKTDAYWATLDIFYSSQSVPGEGEHKIMQYIKDFGTETETYCIYGLDADLIMLGLALFKPHVYILRENMMDSNELFYLDIGQFSKNLKKELNTSSAVRDFIFLCFLMGNDFLPQIPSLEILNGGIQTVMDIYKDGNKDGNIEELVKYNGDIRFDQLSLFLKQCVSTEQSSLIDKYKHRDLYFPDELMNTYFKDSLDFEAYKKAYYTSHFESIPIEQICFEYFKGLQWVIHYYIVKIPSWSWNYPYHYAPFLSDLVAYNSIHSIAPFTYSTSVPCDPFQQLLAVLPPSSRYLVPFPLCDLIISSPIKKYYPEEFEIDVSGKRREWEGIVKIPMMDFEELNKIYTSSVLHVDEKYKYRNGRDLPIEYDAKHPE